MPDLNELKHLSQSDTQDASNSTKFVFVSGADMDPTALRKAHPHLSVVWREEKTADLMRAVREGTLDAALLAIAVLARTRPALRDKLHRFREEQTNKVLRDSLP